MLYKEGHWPAGNRAAPLLAEQKAYFRRGHLSSIGPDSFDTVASKMQKARKKAYHEQAKAVRDEANAIVGGRKLVYQREWPKHAGNGGE